MLQNLRMGFRKKRSSVFLLPIPKELAEQGKAQTLPFVFIGFLFQCKRLVPNKTATSGKAPHEAFLPGFGAELKLVGLQYFHRFQSIAAQTKRQKFQLRCALYPRPEGRGFTARWVKNQLVSFLILDSSSAISLSKNSCAVIPFGTSGINPGPSRVFSIQRIALSAPVLHIST